MCITYGELVSVSLEFSGRWCSFYFAQVFSFFFFLSYFHYLWLRETLRSCIFPHIAIPPRGLGLLFVVHFFSVML
ncbi:hypothetical protein MUK42_35520 [Musa troglodytarum]|uniref:Uncharacterized protein n=1 Tax=Musa troglodytarum TaxID=320322 RepID=A0A9E7KGV7_9LILI|nr:hypothetical protein MUK42_35520 [Musa troglodytarum]